ncbi:MAG: FG-GAP repeat protein, partial [Planctomycetota bacterium]
SQNGDLFGYSLAVGDFNGDGFDDLAIGVPKEDVLNNTRKDAGAVDIVYGSNDGLTLAYQNRWSLIQSNISNGHSESGELFGSVLVAGDFDGDGFDDLAIGTPFDENKYGGNQGNIDVVYGSNWGITAWSGGATLTPEESIGDTGWGFVIEMAVGDFNNDGIEDLVVGSPGVHGYRGAVDFVFGNSARELMKGPRLIQAESSRLFGSQFGTNVVVGDFNGDGYVDMAATSFVGTYDDLFNFMSPDFVDIYFSDERGLNVRLDQRLEI